MNRNLENLLDGNRKMYFTGIYDTFWHEFRCVLRIYDAIFQYDTFWHEFRCVLRIYDAIFQEVICGDYVVGIIRWTFDEILPERRTVGCFQYAGTFSN